MFSKIILAVDLTSAADEIMQCANGFKAIGTTDILLAMCVSVFEGASLCYSYSDQDLKDIIKSREDSLIDMGYNVKSEIIFGSIHKEINRIAKEQNYSAIVIGSHDHTLSSDILLGSVATEMIHYSTKPIFVIRLEIIKNKDSNDLKCKVTKSCDNLHSSILYPTDFSKNSDEAFLYVEKLVKSGAENITLMHVQDTLKFSNLDKEDIEEFNQIDKDRLDKLAERLKNISSSLKIQTLITTGKPGPEIVKISKELNPSLIVMGSKGRGYIEELFMGSVCHYVARLSKTNVLLVPLINKK